MAMHSLWMVCSGFFLVTPLNDMFLERSWPIETEYLFKKIPAWHYLLVIFSKNWKYISKIIGNLKYGAKSKMEIFCKKFFMKFFMVQNVFWNFKNQYKNFWNFLFWKFFINLILIICHKLKIVVNPYFSVFWKNH